VKVTTRRWLHGISGGFIGGFAGAIDSGLALIVLAPEKFNLGPGLGFTLKTTLVLGLLTGAKTCFAYLKTVPDPSLIQITKEDSSSNNA